MGIERLPRGFARVGSAGQERTVEGRTGLFFKEDEIRIRKFDKGVELNSLRGDAKSIQAALKDNNLDEIVFRTAEGDRYVIYADELIGDAHVGDPISVGALQGTVELVDDEWNENRVAAGFVVVGAGVGFYLGGLMAAATVAKAGLAWGDTVAVLSATTATGSGGTLGWVATSASGFLDTDDAKLRAISNETQGWKMTKKAPK